MSGSRSEPKPEYEVVFQARRCDAPDSRRVNGRCPNIVWHWAQPKGYDGPVYCMEHAALTRAKR